MSLSKSKVTDGLDHASRVTLPDEQADASNIAILHRWFTVLDEVVNFSDTLSAVKAEGHVTFCSELASFQLIELQSVSTPLRKADTSRPVIFVPELFVYTITSWNDIGDELNELKVRTKSELFATVPLAHYLFLMSEIPTVSDKDR